MARRGNYGHEKRQKELKKKKKQQEKLEKKLLKKQGELAELEEGTEAVDGAEEQTEAVDGVEEPEAGAGEGDAVTRENQES